MTIDNTQVCSTIQEISSAPTMSWLVNSYNEETISTREPTPIIDFHDDYHPKEFDYCDKPPKQ